MKKKQLNDIRIVGLFQCFNGQRWRRAAGPFAHRSKAANSSECSRLPNQPCTQRYVGILVY